MVDIVEGRDGNAEQMRLMIAATVEQMLGRRSEESDEIEEKRLHEKIDERVDRKFDKFKLWLLGTVILNLAPMLITAGSVVWFAADINSKIENLTAGASGAVSRVEYEAFRREVERRLEADEGRIGTLETYHRQN